MVSYLPFPSLFHVVDALTAANAHIASLEAKLNASRKAWDTAIAAKVAAEKSAKLVATKAKKAEKALADAEQGCAQRDLAVAECLGKISALLSGKYHVIYVQLLHFFLVFLIADIFLSSFIFAFCATAENVGLPLAPCQPDVKDPLMAAVVSLESDWASVQKFL
jgi:hypothetical protein